MATGPSTKPIRISGRPLVTAINDGSFTNSNGAIGWVPNCNLVKLVTSIEAREIPPYLVV